MKLGRKLILLTSLALLVFSPIAARAQFMFDENPLIGKQAPDFNLKMLAGEPMTLSQYRGNDPALIFFWATWCPHCREELTLLSKQAEVFQKSGIKVVLVNLEENPRLVKSYINKLKLPFNVFLDETSQVAEQYSVIGLPTVFFVDKSGVITKMEFGLPENFVQSLKAQANKKG